MSRKETVESAKTLKGSFYTDAVIGKDTVFVLESPVQGLFTGSINSPDGSTFTLSNKNSPNWNDPNEKSVAVASVNISQVNTGYHQST